MIDREPRAAADAAGGAAAAQPEQPLLPASAGVGGRSGDHAADRRAASGLPVRGQPDAARSAARRGRRDRPASRCATMMRRMGIEAMYRRPNTSKPAPGTRSIRICCAAWRSSGRTRCGRWTSPTSRWRAASSTWRRWWTGSAGGFWRGGCRSRMEVDFCLEAVEEALARYGKPEIFNTDQGSQFTSAAFTGLLLENGIAISMDGRGAWRDNVFVERLWRSVKYEEVYLRAYDSVGEARASLGRYLDFYNRKRPHSSLDARTPDHAYFDQLPQACGSMNFAAVVGASLRSGYALPA